MAAVPVPGGESAANDEFPGDIMQVYQKANSAGANGMLLVFNILPNLWPCAIVHRL
jgi:hypothetical protein